MLSSFDPFSAYRTDTEIRGGALALASALRNGCNQSWFFSVLLVAVVTQQNCRCVGMNFNEE